MLESLKKGRSRLGRRSLTALVSAALVVGVTLLPATSASAFTCKVNATEEPSWQNVQDLFDNASVPTVTFYGDCDLADDTYGENEWTIARNVAVVGAKVGTASAYVTGDSHGPLFLVKSGSVTFSGDLELADNGWITGAGIYVEGGSVSVSGNVDFTNLDSAAGAGIYVEGGSVSVAGATGGEMYLNSAEYGAAIYLESGTLTLSNLTIRDNDAEEGGGVYVENGTVTATGVTFENNSATLMMITDAGGGAVAQKAGTVTLNSSTFEGNDSDQIGGAVWSDGGTLRVNSSTFVDNSAVYAGGAVYLGPDSASTFNAATFDGNMVEEGEFDDVDRGDGGALFVEATATTAISRSTFVDNASDGRGGAIYHTGNNLTIDRSTFTSNEAMEFGGAIYTDGGSDTSVTNSAFTGNFTWPSNGPYYSAGGAIYGYEADYLNVAGSTFTRNGWDDQHPAWPSTEIGGAIYLDGGLGKLSVEGRARGITTASVSTGFIVTRSTFNGNGSHGWAGAIWLEFGDLLVSQSTFNNNIAPDAGGAIFGAYVGTLTIQQSTFAGNQANDDYSNDVMDDWNGWGGAVFSDGLELVSVSGSKFTNNFADNPGGAIATIETDETTVTGSTFTGNYAHDDGGAIFVGNDLYEYRNSLTVTGSTFTSNRAAYGGSSSGGAIYVVGYDSGEDECNGVATIIRTSTFTKNYAENDAGAVGAVCDSPLSVYGSKFISNSAGDQGGAILTDDVSYESIVFDGSTFQKNTSIDDGGALALWGAANNTVFRGVTVTGNRSGDNGGGLSYVVGCADTDLLSIDSKSKFDQNVAMEDGGGIWVNSTSECGGTDINLRGSVSGNRATNGSGGGLYIDVYDDFNDGASDLWISAAKIDRNTSLEDGGGIFIADGDESLDVRVDDSVGTVSISYNRATQFDAVGGGIAAVDVNDFIFDTYIDNGAKRIVIARNFASRGGGIFLQYNDDDSILDYGVYIEYNSTGGVCDYNNTLDYEYMQLVGNVGYGMSSSC